MHGPILNLLFPNANQGAFIFQVSALTIIFTVLEQTVNGALQGLGKIYVPAIALTIGVGVKFILNLILVPIPAIGATGAAFATAMCHAIAFGICFYVLKKHMKLDLKFSKFIVKPFLATIVMAVCSYAVYLLLGGINSGKVVTIISILVAAIIYVLALIALKIFTKEELLMVPYGGKFYKILERLRLYKETQNTVK